MKKKELQREINLLIRRMDGLICRVEEIEKGQPVKDHFVDDNKKVAVLAPERWMKEKVVKVWGYNVDLRGGNYVYRVFVDGKEKAIAVSDSQPDGYYILDFKDFCTQHGISDKPEYVKDEISVCPISNFATNPLELDRWQSATQKEYQEQEFNKLPREELIDNYGKEHPEKYCDKCGNINTFWFADNEKWNEIVGGKYSILCPNCFLEMARERGKNWILKVEEVNKEKEPELKLNEEWVAKYDEPHANAIWRDGIRDMAKAILAEIHDIETLEIGQLEKRITNGQIKPKN